MPGRAIHSMESANLIYSLKARLLALSLATAKQGGLGRSTFVHSSSIGSKSVYCFGRLIATKERVVGGSIARLIAISQVIGGFTCERDGN